ncbi:uncharacterized protein LOC135211154 [Macrobrachium nipponense]|uniref:uncharacterized protein LOC135211154 n=1 Tax=Macrobrachium nipponense TaxID=159736 RepID=UPI0030C82279
MATLIFPAGKSAGYVDPKVAAPIIKSIQDSVMEQQEAELPDLGLEEVSLEVVEDLPVTLDMGTGNSVNEASLVGHRGLSSGDSDSSSPSTSNSFMGFTGRLPPTRSHSFSVIPKIKKKPSGKTLLKGRSEIKPRPGQAPQVHTHIKPRMKSFSKPSNPRSHEGNSFYCPTSPIPSTSRDRIPRKVPQEGQEDSPLVAQDQFNTNILHQVNSLGSLVSSVVARFEEVFKRLGAQDSLIAGLRQESAVPAPSSSLVQAHSMPDGSTLPPFHPGNLWRVANFAPFVNGMLTIEGCGTRRLEDFEFFPEGLQPPFIGYVRLTEAALVREDKVPKETVILSRDQAQQTWIRSLEEWNCSNTRVTVFKSPFTMFTTDDENPLPFTSKVAELTLQAVTREEPMPQLRETDPTSLLLPGREDLWEDLPATFSVGKLKPDCAITLFSERLPKLSDALIQAEFDAKTRLARSLNSLVMTETAAREYAQEPLLKVIAKSLLLGMQCDLYDFAVARRNCRKHVLSEATIRHEPNKLLASSIWGADLFPASAVNEVQSEASRLNQSIILRWGIPFKRKSESSPSSFRARKRQRKFQPFQVPQQHPVLQAVPVQQVSQPSTSKAQPHQQH